MSGLSKDELALRGAVSLMPQADQNTINALADELRKVVSDAGDIGIIAFTLVGLELQRDR